MFLPLRISVVAMLLLGTAFACKGNACGDLKFTANGNCHTITNVGSKPIRVKWGDTFGPKDLGPGESWTITNPFGGACVGYIAGEVEANYITPPPSPPPAPPAPPPPYPDSDPTFHYLGERSFSRGAGGTALTESPWWVILFPGADDLVIDYGYRQENDAVAKGWFVSHIGEAYSPTTVRDIPAGFLVRTEGNNNFSFRDPRQIKRPGTDVDAFQITMYCGPPAHYSCSVGLKVWVKMKPKSSITGPPPASPSGVISAVANTHS
jgi:hypothetical protein